MPLEQKTVEEINEFINIKYDGRLYRVFTKGAVVGYSDTYENARFIAMHQKELLHENRN